VTPTFSAAPPTSAHKDHFRRAPRLGDGWTTSEAEEDPTPAGGARTFIASCSRRPATAPRETPRLLRW
jgi:hypothetical protein